jgi:Mg/Co/Ni transporter MgtE
MVGRRFLIGLFNGLVASAILWALIAFFLIIFFDVHV